MIEIVAGNHVPDLPFVIVNRVGCHVDLTGIAELWDGPTVAAIRWGLRDNGGVQYGRVTLKDGTRTSIRGAGRRYGLAETASWIGSASLSATRTGTRAHVYFKEGRGRRAATRLMTRGGSPRTSRSCRSR